MSNEAILITGASSDIGKELISRIDASTTVIALYNNSPKQLEGLSQNIIPMKADFNSEGELDGALDKIESDHGVPTQIVHLAANKVENIRFKDLDWKNFEQELNTSFRSIVKILGRFLPKMAKSKRGKVVIMLSSYTLGTPPIALSHYTTTKYALLGLVKSLASEYASKNIQINAISPSMVETKFLESIDEKIVELNAYNHPLKRNANVGDVVPAIEMLLSKESDYMTGVNLPITGGSVI